MGSSASRVYDWVNTSAQTTRKFSAGPAIPAGLLDQRYVPQGLASWPNWNGKGQDILPVSAYLDTNGDKEPDGASAVFGVVTNGKQAGTGLGRMPIGQGHVGGLAVYKGWLYVGSESEIRGYRLKTVRSALAGANTAKVYPRAHNRESTHRVGFMGSGDGHLWAGASSKTSATHLNGYTQTSASTGALSFDSATQATPTTSGLPR